MTALVLKPGAATLGQWLAIHEGATPSLDPAMAATAAAGAAAVERNAKGDPVYGINTGFGKLASVRIAANDVETCCSATSSRRIAAVPGEPLEAGGRAAGDGAEARLAGSRGVGRAAGHR